MFGANANAREVLWTILGLLALALNLVLLSRTVGNLRALDALGLNGGRRQSAWTAIGIQVGLTLAQAVMVAIGIAALRLPASKAPTLTGTIVGGGLVVNQAVMAGVAVYALARWHILDRYFDARDSAATRQAETVAETRHSETMGELTHNTEITTEARDGADRAYAAANAVNLRIIGVQQDIAATNKVAGESAHSLEDYMRQLEAERAMRDAESMTHEPPVEVVIVNPAPVPVEIAPQTPDPDSTTKREEGD